MVTVKVKNPRNKPISINEQVSKEDEDKLFQHILETSSSAQAQETKKKKEIKLLGRPEPIKEDLKKEIKKKPDKKIMEIVKKIDFSKPLQEETKKEIVDRVEEIKTEEKIKRPYIEYSNKETTRYDLNWYYLKEQYVNFVRWLWSPYTHYVIWFNKTFNKVKEDMTEELTEQDENELHPEWQTSNNLEDLYEKLPVLKDKFPVSKDELEELMKIRKALRKLEYDEDLKQGIVRSEK